MYNILVDIILAPKQGIIDTSDNAIHSILFRYIPDKFTIFIRFDNIWSLHDDFFQGRQYY